ncbi:Glycosyl hydrolase family 57 [uncultured archaeon]|nr:Glycosyl hydrolase family 57 [uncultured archaeon]
MVEKTILYFHVHQPFRLKKRGLFETSNNFFDEEMNKHYFEKATRQCYLKANKILLDNLNSQPEFKFNLSITGTFIEQCYKYNSEVLDSFKKLTDTGQVEILGETYYHSLASLFKEDTEFQEQVKEHSEKINEVFGQHPTTFRNTEALYNNEIAARAKKLGFKNIITEGVERILGYKSPNYLYESPSKMKLLMRNYPLSDDVGYRFSQKSWSEFPLTTEKYTGWIKNSPGDVANIFMDYETFGEHHWEDTGILNFLKYLPNALKNEKIETLKIQETCNKIPVRDEISVPQTISWADMERDESAWLGNRMQKRIFKELEDLAIPIKKVNRPELLKDYRKLQTSDHLHYLCTKSLDDQDVHNYFSPYKGQNAYENFVEYSVLMDQFKEKVKEYSQENNEKVLV